MTTKKNEIQGSRRREILIVNDEIRLTEDVIRLKGDEENRRRRGDVEPLIDDTTTRDPLKTVENCERQKNDKKPSQEDANHRRRESVKSRGTEIENLRGGNVQERHVGTDPHYQLAS
jgi:hypothetical protein